MKKLQYTTNDPSSSTDYLAGDNTWKPMSGGGGGVPYTGATQNVDLGEYGLSGGFIEFDTTPTSTPTTQGTMSWDVDHNTVQLVMNGHVGQVMQDQFYFAKNQTGSTIPKGTVVMAAGTLGASGRILIAPFLADGTYPSEYVMGVTAEDIIDGADGMVMHFGQLRSIDTSAYSDGDLLYASTTSAGAFTTTAPTAPNNIVLVAIVIYAAANGVIQVRPTIGSNINNDEGVSITSPTNGQVLTYNSTSGLWENTTPSSSGTSKTILGGSGSSTALSSGATYYLSMFNTVQFNTDSTVRSYLRNAGTFTKASVFFSTAFTGSCVCTLMVSGVASAMTFTIAAGSAAGVYPPTSPSLTPVTILDSDYVTLRLQQSGGAGGTLRSSSFTFEI